MEIIDQIYDNPEINHIYENYKWTPVMQHWKEVKETAVKKYGKKTIVFYQLGTFFECYFHDAYISSKLVSQTLTSKNKKNPLAAPMAGSPISVGYKKAKDLVRQGYNVVMVEEKGIAGTKEFQRVITQVLTPGTFLDNLDSLNNDFIYSITFNYNHIGVTFLDLSSNLLYGLTLKEGELHKLNKYFSIFPPKEILYEENISLDQINGVVCNFIPYGSIDITTREKSLKIAQKLANKPILKESLNALFTYIEDIHQTSITYIEDISIINPEDFFYLEENTIKHLEILKNNKGYIENSVLEEIRTTQTSFGGRQLKNLLLQPSINKKKLEARYDIVDYFKNYKDIKKITYKLFNVTDIERLSSKLISGTVNPNDILSLKKSLVILEEIKDLLLKDKKACKPLQRLLQRIPDITEFIAEIDNILLETGGVTAREGNIINSGVNGKLDKLILKTDKRNLWYKDHEQELIEKTGVNLRVSENNMGAYIEVRTDEDVTKLKEIEGFRKIKMLKDYDRYETKELVSFYRDIFDARIERNELEYKLFERLRLKLSIDIYVIHRYSKIFAYLDVFISFASNAINKGYTRPQLSLDKELHIIEGRHLIVEKKKSFQSNTLNMNEKEVHCITGPNMGGKSTYLRQNALIILLAQIGSFIPAKEGSTIGIVDNIFTRIGSGDNLAEGESTFYTEMRETSEILNKATSKSFILLDELGRGTSTEDGEAIAQAVVEYCCDNKIRTLFATHYHGLSKLEKDKNNFENYHVEASISVNDKINFSHKIKKGSHDKSYGIEIAELADIPKSIINRANKLKRKI